MKFVCWMAVSVVITVLLLGCSENKTQAHAGQAVPVVQEFKGQQGPFPDRGFIVVQDPTTWKSLWAGRPAPNVDFTQYSVLVALMGQQPTAGYSVNITDVRATGTQIMSYLTETKPKPGDQVAQVLTYPYDMVVVPKLTQPVAFHIEGAQIQPVAIQHEYTGQQSQATNPQTVVIRDAAAWNTFWANTFGTNSTPPAVDFNNYMATAVLIGRKPTAGYSVFITGASDTGQRIEVNYRAIGPAPNETPPPGATSPYAIAILAASPQAVAFRPITTVVMTTASAAK